MKSLAYVANKNVREDVIALVSGTQMLERFSTYEVRKEVINLSSTYISKVMGIPHGRDAFIELLYHVVIGQKGEIRKTTFSNHWMRKYPNLIRIIYQQLPINYG